MTLQELSQLCNRINALPMPMPMDAKNAAVNFDFASLAWIANVADGLAPSSSRGFGDMADLADMLQGITPRIVYGNKR